MNKRTIWSFLLILVLLAACQSGNDEAVTPETPDAAATAVTAPDNSSPTIGEEAAEAPEPQDVQTIRFAVYDWDSGRYEDLIDAFEEEYPQYQIKTVSVNEVLELDPFGGEWPEDAELRLASAADVLATGVSRASGEQGLLLDISPFLEADTAVSADDFYPGVLEQYQWNGGTWGLPMTVNFELIYFDKDAFDEAGLTYPEAGWSWDDLAAAAQALTVREGDEVVRWGFVQPYPNALAFVQGQAGELVDQSTDPPTIRLDDPEVVEAVQWYADLFLTLEAAPYFPPADEEESSALSLPEGYSLIEEGKAAMWPEHSATWSYRSQQGNLGIVPYPVSSANDKSTPIYTEGMAISAGTNKPDAAWAWLAFLSDQQKGTALVGSDPGSLPARRSVAESSGFWDNVDEELGVAYRYAVDHAYASVYVDWGYEAFNEAITAVLAEEKDVAVALADAQIAAEAARDEALTTGDNTEPTPEITVIEEEEIVNPDATTIEFMAGGGFDQQAYRDLARQFQEENPNIVVEIKQPNFFSGAPTMSDLAQDSDCFQWFPSLTDEESLAAILSLEPFLDNDPNTSKDDFFPAALDQMTHQGQVWALPGDATVVVMEYNKDLFDAAGLDYPAADWTVDDFLDTAVALSSGEGEERVYGYIPDLFEPSDMIAFLDRLGADMMDDSVDPPRINLTDPTVIEAVRWYTNLTTEYDVKPTFITSLGDTGLNAYEERQTLLDNGRGGMWTANSGNFVVVFPGQEDAEERNIGVAPLPSSVDGRASGGFQSVNGYFISANTDARQECWDWITFLTRQPNVGNGLPSRIEVAQSAAYQQEVGAERAAAYLHSIENVNEASFYQRFSDENSWMSIAFFWIISAYDQVLNEGVPVEGALQQAQITADAYRDCVITNDALNDEKAQQACLQEVDDTLPDYIFSTEE